MAFKQSARARDLVYFIKSISHVSVGQCMLHNIIFHSSSVISHPFFFFQTAFSLGAVFAHSLVLFTVLRFATAASLTGFFVAQYVYSLEIVGPSYRTLASQCSQLFWTFGETGVALLAYYIREWRTLLLVISCPPALFIFLWL